MALAEELLDNISEEQAIEYAMIESKPHIVIDEDRNIVFPERYKMIAAQGDHNVATYTFDCPRFSDGRDMSEMVVYINYIRSDGVPGSYPADNVTIDEQNANLMHFEWTLLLPATLEAGVLAFLVCVCKSGDDGKIENHWSSRMCREAMISEGMDCHADTIVDLYPDVITRILERLNILEGGGVASVQYTVQNLEEEQKVQARKNIGAASAEKMACKWVLISNGETKTKIDGSSYEVPEVIKCVIPNAGGEITFEEKNSFSLHSKSFPWQTGGLREEIYRVEENTVITVSANISVYILDDKGYSYLKKDINKLSEDIADLKENGTGGGSATSGKGWTTEQIDLLDSLLSLIPFTSFEGGTIADRLITSLRSGAVEPDNPEDNPDVESGVTQNGRVLTIVSGVATSQSGTTLMIA